MARAAPERQYRRPAGDVHLHRDRSIPRDLLTCE